MESTTVGGGEDSRRRSASVVCAESATVTELSTIFRAITVSADAEYRDNSGKLIVKNRKRQAQRTRA